MLGESAWSVAMTPGPMKAFFERMRARRGAQVAAVAAARKLAVLFWHLLTREEDYAFARPSMTRKKLRALELAAARSPSGGASTTTARFATRRSAPPSGGSPSRARSPIGG